MNQETELALSIARNIVYHNKNGDDGILGLVKGNINWEQLKDCLIHHRLFPFAYLIFKEYFSLLPKEFYQNLKTSYYHSLKSAFDFQHRFLELCRIFDEKGICLIPIKGVALLEDLYHNYPLRLSSDIDALVRKEDLSLAGKILEELGYKKNLEGLRESYWRNRQYHFVFTPPLGIRAGGASDSYPILELHWAFDYPRQGKELLPCVFSRLREFSIQDKKIKLLSVEDTFFTLALHQRRFGVTLCLRDVCDMALLLNKYGLNFDWDYVLSESKKSNLCSTVFFALYQVKVFFNIGIPQFVWKGLGLSLFKRRAIKHFIEKNTLSSRSKGNKNLYLKAHFLLYDSFLEPINYILNIPQEQFAKFYGFSPYDRKTEFFYKNRQFYILYKAFHNLISRKSQ